MGYVTVFEHFSNKRKIEELQEDFAKLKREFAGLTLEWQNTLNKLLHITGRMNKRAALAQEREDAMMGELPVVESGRPLTPRQQLINAQIASRRAQNNPNGPGETR